MKRHSLSAACRLLIFLACSNALPAEVQFNRDIRPILAENCYSCHGPDSASRKADLRFDREEGLFGEREKGRVVTPKDLAKSLLYQRIMSSDPEEVMPPPKSHKTLTEAQKAFFRQWIEQGAPWEKHWSFLAPKKSALPQPRDPSWARQPFDQFVLARLEKAGLKPAPEANRRALARRVSLDLTGLPPGEPELEAFLADESPDAYEKFVDRLLDAPTWGEHRGRYWLDAARYADSHGIHFDNFRETWAYRDWVIGAFNRNLPFDEFTIEQLAGDLLPNRGLDQLVASGFNRCNITTNEGGAIDEEYLVLYARDRTETTSQVWMGLTAGCAVCHDHKLDPISQREFYQLASFFNNTTQAAMDGNIKDTPPIVTVPQARDRARHEELTSRIAEANPKLEARKQSAKPDFEAWLDQAKPSEFVQDLPSQGLVFHAKLDEAKPTGIQALVNGQPARATFGHAVANEPGRLAPQAFKLEGDQFADFPEAANFERDQPFSVGVWLRLSKEDKDGALCSRMKDGQEARGWDIWLEQGQIGFHLVHSLPSNYIKVLCRDRLEIERWHHVGVTYDGSSKASGVSIYVDGVAQATNTMLDGLNDTTKTATPFRIGSRTGGARLLGAALQDLRIHQAKLSSEEMKRMGQSPLLAYLLAKPSADKSEADRSELFQWWLGAKDKTYGQMSQRLRDMEREKAEIQARGTIAFVMNEKPTEPMAHVLFRGDYDKRRNAVKVGTPAVLPSFPSGAPKNRLGLAQWLVNSEHPLTARVTVNRFWQELFGTGLVKTSGDFGIAGEAPSHPELLDWLAVEFREQGWDVKRFFKMLVTSATYRQATEITPEKLERDHDNRLLSRGPRFRMDGEMLRDQALASSGLLAKKIGGPSVKPYQPPGVWEAVAMIGSNTRDYKQDQGADLYRRGLYTFWKRSAPPASLDIFNAPSRENCTVRRERTNTPLQALVTLNDPQFIESARNLAESALRANSPEARWKVLGNRLLSRPLQPRELSILEASLTEFREHYETHPQDAQALLGVGESKATHGSASELAAWAMVINQLMNLDEFLNK